MNRAAFALAVLAAPSAFAQSFDVRSMVRVEIHAKDTGELAGSMSGFVTGADGTVVTAAVLFEDVDAGSVRVVVRRLDATGAGLIARLEDAEVVAGDRASGIAILHVPSIAADPVPALKVASSEKLALLDPVVTACFAGSDESPTMKRGEVTRVAERLAIDVPVSPGCSGGPVVGAGGSVIGVLYGVMRTSTSSITLVTRSEQIRDASGGRVALGTPAAGAKPEADAPAALFARWQRLDGYVKAITGAATVYLLLVVLMVLVWLVAPAKVAEWAMVDETATTKPAWKWLGEAVALIRWLGGSNRALDAWLRKNDKTLFARAFGERPAVERRQTYVDLGNERDVADVEERAGANAPTAVWIAGPGGCGKSTLAMEMARRARAAAKRRPLVPVLVDKGWGKESELEDALAVPLRIGDRKPDGFMLRKMARKGRLLLVVDGVSEIDVSGTQASELVRTGAFRHVIVTSREPVVEGAGFRPVGVGPLEGERLSTFVRRYGADEAVAASLRRWTDGRPVRPLLARVAIEQLRAGELLPQSFPDLVVSYVRALRTRGAKALREDDFLRAARLAAKLCVEEALAPRSMSGDFFRGHADAASAQLKFTSESGEVVQSTHVLDQLLKSGLLVRSQELMESRLRFADDPVAEYLFVLDVVRQGPAAIEALRKRLASGSGVAEALEEVVPATQSATT